MGGDRRTSRSITSKAGSRDIYGRKVQGDWRCRERCLKAGQSEVIAALSRCISVTWYFMGCTFRRWWLQHDLRMELLAFSHQMVIHCTITQAQLRHNVVLNFHCAAISLSLSLYIYIYIHTHTAAAAAAKSLQSCPTLCDSIDGSPPGSPVPAILQARTLEWVAISFSSA